MTKGVAREHDHDDEMVDLYENGLWNIREIAEKFGWPYTSTHTRLKELGVKFRPTGTPLGTQWKPNEV